MLVITTGWWVLFFAAVGLAVGSYLNVVIYRIPRGLSTTAPLWSFCPRCQERIRWYDNLPVISFLRLGGRCRACGAPISARYPAVEMLMAMLTLVLLDAFCVAGLRGGTTGAAGGLNEQLYHDWPILLAHLVLFGCLLAMSAIDLEHYFIDIRFTNFAIGAGVVLHGLWTPRAGSWRPTVAGEWHRPGVTTAAVSLVTALVAAATVIVIRRWMAPGQTQSGEAGVTPVTDSQAAHQPPEGGVGPPSGASAAAALVALGFLLVVVTTAIDASTTRRLLYPDSRLLVPLAICFVLLLGAAAPRRASDTEIVEAIEAERHSARAVALGELLVLLPALLSGVATAWLCLKYAAFWDGWKALLDWSPWGSWRPLTGLATAASGFVIAAALGWAVRIVFTLLLGREAFGTGDIHLMAAAGCVAGWPAVVMGFVLTSFLALSGWLVTLPIKRTRAIPLVPWLSLAFLIVVVFHSRLCDLAPVRNTVALFEAVSSGQFTGPASETAR